jgi:hypothetical protein
VTTTASLIVTAEELPGLTCQAWAWTWPTWPSSSRPCTDPATHTVDTQQGTGTAVETSTTYYVCQPHVVLLLQEGLGHRGSVLHRLNPNTWSA